ncbi:MAG: DUF445 domain-containing protein [candidate division NC10 bacterium]
MSDLKRMRIIATSALVLMAVLYILARSLEHHALFWSYVAAFAEAAMVGALADWFAVVALFRHPMGIPIPHTAIIPTNKDRIGRTLATFVVTNFLTGEAIRQRLEKIDLTAKAAEWLWANARDVSDRIVAAAPAFLRVLRDEDVQRLLHGTLLAKLRAIDVAPLAGKVLKTVTSGDALDEVVGAGVQVAEDLVRANRALIEAQVRKRILLPEFLGLSFVKDRLSEIIAEKVSAALLENLRDMRERETHPFRVQFRAKALELAEALQHSEAYREKGEKLKEEILQHPAVRAHLGGLVRDLVREFEADLAAPDSRIRAQVERAVIGASHLLMEDHALRAKLNGWLREMLADGAERHGEEASRFIQDRVRKWDAVQLTKKLEEAVGRDLQYVRLNGTIVGGLVGLLIYTISKWVW